MQLLLPCLLFPHPKWMELTASTYSIGKNISSIVKVQQQFIVTLFIIKCIGPVSLTRTGDHFLKYCRQTVIIKIGKFQEKEVSVYPVFLYVPRAVLNLSFFSFLEVVFLKFKNPWLPLQPVTQELEAIACWFCFWACPEHSSKLYEAIPPCLS